MTRDKFKEIYYCTVMPTAEKLISDRNAMVREATGDVSSPAFSFCDNFGGLYESYLLKKNSIKIVLKKDTDKEDSVLDRHKVSAALVCSISGLHLISDNRVDERDGNARYPIHEAHRLNEQLAFWCGVSTLMMYMSTECKKYTYSEGALDKIRSALDKDGMTFPPSLTGTQYVDSAIRGLFYSGNFFSESPILLANTFYWMEQYFYKSIDVTVAVTEPQPQAPAVP